MGNHPDIADASAFMWQGEKTIDLGLPLHGCGADARAIADCGTRVVGTSHFSGPGKFCFDRRAFLWIAGTFHDLGTLPGYAESYGWGMSGDAVFGYCHSDDLSSQAAFIYFNGRMVRHDSLVDPGLKAIFATAEGSNDAGQLLADGFIGETRVAVLLTPVWAAVSDFDANCQTDMNDVLTIISEWGKPESPADIDGNGVVGIGDLLIVIQNWTFLK